MPRIAETEIERIKTEVSLLDWVRGEGLEVVRKGKDWVVLCPFHEEDTPSCVITPESSIKTTLEAVSSSPSTVTACPSHSNRAPPK